jgi:cell division protein FtsB
MTCCSNSEALRLADVLDKMRGPYLGDGVNPGVHAYQLAALLRTQAASIAELEAEIANLHTTMMAAAVEIQAQWFAHCDSEGYGPANLMHRLERGIASKYGYDAKTLQRVESERDQLRAEVERLRKPMMEEHIAQAVRPLYKDAQSAAMGLLDDIATTRAIEAAKEVK